MSVVGARPQFVKLPPIVDALTAAGEQHVIVHSGQHYDALLSDVFFSDLGIPAPDVHLGVGSGGHGAQTGAILAALDDVLTQHAPDWMLVYGDANSTFAAAVSAIKLQMPLAHLEAGLRSFNRAMPEEHNRVLTDHAADLLLAPTEVAIGHLEREGLGARPVLVGDVMTDVLHRTRGTAAGTACADGSVVATIHRAENTDDPRRLARVIEGLASIDKPVLLLAHPRLRARAERAGIDMSRGHIQVRDPLAYPDLVATAAASAGVVTDSGGCRRRRSCSVSPAPPYGPRPSGLRPSSSAGTCSWSRSRSRAPWPRPQPSPTDATPYGDGRAAARVVAAMRAHLIGPTSR